MPPTDAVYPVFGVTVKDVVEPWFTVCAVLGLMVPPDPAEGVTVQVLIFAEQLAVVPPYDPVQFHDQGPLPVTDVDEPALQRLVAGADVNVPLFDVPQTPLTGPVV